MTPFRALAPPALAALLVLLAPAAYGDTAPAKAAPAKAAAPAGSEPLSLEWIMSDPLTWLARPPVEYYFSDDGKSVYFTQDRAGKDGRDLSRIDLASGETTLIEDAQRGRADAERGYLSPDRRTKVFIADGDVFWKNLQTGEVRQLTRTAAPETNPILLLDGRVAFQRGDLMLVRDMKTGLEAQAADLQLGKDPLEKPEPEDYIGRQQARQLDVVRERLERKKETDLRRRERQRNDPTQPPVPFYLGEGKKIAAQFLSPSGKAMLVVLEPKEPNEGRAEKMANFVSNDGYIEILEVRTKVGTGKPVSPTLVLLDLENHQRYDFDPAILSGIEEDPLADLRQEADARKAAEKKAAEAKKAAAGDSGSAAAGATEAAATDAKEAQGELAESQGDDKKVEEAEALGTEKEAEKIADTGAAPCAADAGQQEGKKEGAVRTVEFFDARFSPDGRRVVFSVASTDHKHRWMVAASLAEPRFHEIHRLERRGWINWDFNEFGFLPNGSIYFLSEESGYSQLYLHDFAGGENRRLTEGDFTVADPVVSPDGKWIYVAANPDHPGIFGVYRAATGAAKGGAAWESLSSLGGTSEFRLSPDGSALLLLHSKTTAPPELYLQEAKAGAKARQISRTTLEKFGKHSWVAPQIVAIPSRHGGPPIYSRYYPPRTTEPRRGPDGKIPAVIFIHGAGYLQNAHQGWSTYAREFLFHTWLSEHGYAVLDMDYRGSAGYGADFREAIYRYMGGPEVEDLEDGLAWLADNHGVDPRRVGLYGGSYGGFLTLMGLFTRPEVFACGAALRPVTDWAHYNHGYTSNILNTPDLDPVAYERSSPIEFAQGLTKPLLICAPMQDDNVFFQDSVRLAQRLIELEKNDWEVAIYPVEPHGFRRPSSWLDEYKRIFKLFEGCLDS